MKTEEFWDEIVVDNHRFILREIGEPGVSSLEEITKYLINLESFVNSIGYKNIRLDNGGYRIQIDRILTPKELAAKKAAAKRALAYKEKQRALIKANGGKPLTKKQKLAAASKARRLKAYQKLHKEFGNGKS